MSPKFLAIQSITTTTLVSDTCNILIPSNVFYNQSGPRLHSQNFMSRKIQTCPSYSQTNTANTQQTNYLKLFQLRYNHQDCNYYTPTYYYSFQNSFYFHVSRLLLYLSYKIFGWNLAVSIINQSQHNIYIYICHISKLFHNPS